MAREFERTSLGVVQKKIGSGCGFVVGGHNYGRVERMSDEELHAVAKGLVDLIDQVFQLWDAIGLVERQRYDQDTVALAGRYAIE